tara:strand:+ start:317 stop:541 length:225 start_codon:yes stop_codon:yes gene_type:complete
MCTYPILKIGLATAEVGFHNSPLVTLFFSVFSATTQTRINDLSTTIEILSPNRFFQIDWPFPCPMFFAGLDQLN